MEIVVLAGAIGLAIIGGYFAFRDQKFGRKPKQKTDGEYHHPYDVEKLPTGAYLHFQEGFTLALKRQFESALAEYKLALEIVPNHKGILFYVTFVLLAMDRIEDAEAIVAELLEKNPLDYFAKYLSGSIHHQKGDFDKALKDYNAALYRKMNFAAPYLNRARLHFANQDIQKAQEDINTAKQLEPKNSQVWSLQGYAYSVQQRLEEAKTSYEEAINYNPNDVEALARYAQILSDIGQSDKAHETITSALELAPDYADALFVKGNIKLKQELWDEALAIYQSAIRQTDDIQLLSQINTNLCKIYINLKHYDEAIVAAQNAIEQDSMQFWAYNNRGFAYRQLGKYDLALADYSHAVQLNPHETMPYGNRARIYLLQGNYQAAMDDYNAIIALNPNSISSHNHRGWIKAILGDYEGSLADGEKAIELRSDIPEFYDTRGQAKWLLGDYEGALVDYQKGSELNKDFGLFSAAKAAALYKLNRTDEAIAAWQKLADFEDEAQTADELQEKYHFAEPFYQALKEIEALAKD